MSEFRSIGSLRVSVLGLGGNNFGARLDRRQTREVVAEALDLGITHFDTADAYGEGDSERWLGAALGARRDDVVVVTKFGLRVPPGVRGSRENVLQSLDESLKRLGTDYVDLYLIHRPDPETPVSETLEALAELVRAGKVREIGCSDFSVLQLEEAMVVAADKGLPSLSCLQSEYNLLNLAAEDELLPACERLGISFVPYLPLASGALTGKYRRNEPPSANSRMGDARTSAWGAKFLTPQMLTLIENLGAFAGENIHTLPELALGYLRSTPIVPSVIAGATSPEQLRANAAALTAWDLTTAQRAEVRKMIQAV